MRRVILSLIAFLFLFSSVSYSQFENWRLINPDWDNNLYGFAREDFNDWPFVTTEWAATDNGILLRTRDDWENFQPVQVGNEKINRVNWEFNNDGTTSRIIAVGENGTIVTSKDGGATWDIKTSGTSQNLHGLSTQLQPGQMSTDAFYGWAVGDGSTVLYTFDGGDTWDKQSVEFPMDELRGVGFKDPDSGLIVGRHGIVYKTTNGGSKWEYKAADPSNPHFKDVVFGDSGGVAVAVGESGKIFKTSDNGDTWMNIPSGTNKNLNAVAFGDSGFIAGGDDGTILRAPKSGDSWMSVETGTMEDFNAVRSDSGGLFWAVGNNGTIATNTPPMEEGPDSSRVRPRMGNKGVQVDWDSSGTADEYHVGKQAESDSSDIFDPDKYSLLGSTMSASINDMDVGENSVVTYIIKSQTGNQYSKFTDPYSIHYGLHPPSNLQASPGDSGGVLLEWDRNSMKNARDKVFRNEPAFSDSFGVVNEVPSDSGSFHDTSVEPGKTYKYKVIATNDSSSSASSNIVEITVPTSSLVPPQNLMFMDPTDNTVDLDWDPVSPPIDGYQINRKTEGETDFIFVDTTGSNETTFRDSGLTEGTMYTYNVQSRYQGQKSAFSQPDSGYTMLTPPTNLEYTISDSGGVGLSWQNHSKKSTLVRVFKKDHQVMTPVFGFLAEIPGDSSTYEDMSVMGGNTYSYKVKAANENIWSDFTNTVTVDVVPTSVDFVDQLPDEFRLYQNYPNPFNPTTTIKYHVKEQSLVSIKIYNIIGKEIVRLVNENQSPGSYKIKFHGAEFSSGIYIYEMKAGKFWDSKKLILLK